MKRSTQLDFCKVLNLPKEGQVLVKLEGSDQDDDEGKYNFTLTAQIEKGVEVKITCGYDDEAKMLLEYHKLDVKTAEKFFTTTKANFI